MRQAKKRTRKMRRNFKRTGIKRTKNAEAKGLPDGR